MDYLIENYKEREPIFLTDISIEGMSEEKIRYHLKRLTDIGKNGRECIYIAVFGLPERYRQVCRG